MDGDGDRSKQQGASLVEIADRLMRRERAVRLPGLRGAARAVVAAELVRAHRERPVLVVASSAGDAEAFARDLRGTLGLPEDAPGVRVFPAYDTSPFDRFSPQPLLVARRMEVLHVWLEPEPDVPAPVVVAPFAALAPRLPARERVARHATRLVPGQTIERDALVETLLTAGYARMPVVEDRAEFAVRGGIVDLFPPGRTRPVRVELLGDTVESLREFDPASQRSQQAIEGAVVPPVRELLLRRDEVVARGDAVRELAQVQEVPRRTADELMDALLRGHLPGGVEALAPILLPPLETAFDYLPADALVIITGEAGGHQRLDELSEEAAAGHETATAAGRLVAPPRDLLLEPAALAAALEGRRPVLLEGLDVLDAESERDVIRVACSGNDDLRRDLAQARSSDRALAPLARQIDDWRDRGWRVVLSVSALSHAERLRHLLAQYAVETGLARAPTPVWRWSKPGRVQVRIAPLAEGFTLDDEGLAVVSEEEIFGPRERRRSHTEFREGAVIDGLAQLDPGDPLVHAEHGIGIYRGLLDLRVGYSDGEFLRIEYDGGDKLFVPVHRLNLVHRYVGADGHPPRIDRLGGHTWGKTRKSVKRSLRDMAKELVRVHAERELAPGVAYSPRDLLMEEFEARFPYEETADQEAAIEDVLGDLQQAKPMDRLVCGDVGYGKTEVAARAAFRVAMDGRQVAVLVPTTVLCQQHLETFRARFEGTPVRIESLSRFCTPKEARQVVEGLADGSVDIVIGTHRMLQKQVAFHRLGLLVVDEEQRFGVAHKERIKRLKQTVDVLTLTATPIPRTLQLAFTGLRNLSLIHTAPADRLAIRTQTCRFSESLVREVILREVRRGGQVFFVHNRVQSIAAVGEMLRRTVPEVKLLVAHGQMKERELEERMLAFLHGEADVLLSTAIIESGLDIPRANTIVIHRADTFGLAQLYQLRGRVGRSDKRAYAYLMIPGEDAISTDAKRRLEAIQELTELGSGFRLANMDLEIRGAGNLLGGEQSGNLAAVGYDAYMDMLTEAIESLRGEVRESEVDPEIRLPVAARLPDDYVADVSQRLVLYKRLAGAPDEIALDRIRDELLDRFGPIPEAARLLLRVIRLKIRARDLGVCAVDVARGELVFTAAERSQVEPRQLLALVQHGGGSIRIAPDQRIYAPAPAPDDPDALFDAAENLLAQLAPPGR